MEYDEIKKNLAVVFFVALCVVLSALGAETKRDEISMHSINNSRAILVEEVAVGVILDMFSKEGKIIVSCISIALSDFYDLHTNYTTRLRLHTRNSNGKPLHALSAARNLVDKMKVEAIIGAQTRMEAELLAELGEEAQVPVMSLSQPSATYPFLVQITQEETSQLMGITTLIDMFRWTDVILIYESSTKYKADVIPHLINSFQERNVHIAYKIFISASSTNEHVTKELLKLQKLKTRVLVVHMTSHLLVSRHFVTAKKIGMMSEGYVWIMTSTSMNLLHSMKSSVIEAMQGVLGLKSYIPPSIGLHSLTSRLRRKFYIGELNSEVRELGPDGVRAYDATWALAEAIERARTKNSTNTNNNNYYIGLLAEVLETRFNGLGGKIEYQHGKLISNGFEIVNVIGKGDRRVGFWPCKEEKDINNNVSHMGNRRSLVSTNYLSETIIWPGGSSTIPRGSKMELSEKKLQIGVPVKLGFKELVNVTLDIQRNTTYVTGFCVDVFEAAIRGLPYKVYYEFIPFERAGHLAGNIYNDLVYQVYLKKFDAVVGDTTITSNRSLYVDFTVPYSDLGVGMLVRNEKENMWIFLKPLSADLWITSCVFFILTGVVVWIIERPVNTEFQGSPSQQIGTIFWFSFSTLVFGHREKLLNNLTKFVMIVWVFVVLILTSSYTATLASMMTVKQIQLNSRGIYYMDDFMAFKEPRRYHSVEEYAEALSRGNKHGGVSAIIDEIPYIRIFLSKYSADYSMIRPKSTTNGFGFVFPKGSKLAYDLSRQIKIMREKGRLIEIENVWFQRPKDTAESDGANANTLNFNTFRGLFLVSGVSSASALFLFFIFSFKAKWHVLKTSILGNLIQGQRQFVLKFLSNKVYNVNEQVHI